MQKSSDNQSHPASDLARCIQSLVNDGRAAISAQPSGMDDADALPIIQQMDGLARDELAIELPALSPASALWAARLFYQLCRFTVCRDIPAEQINLTCGIPCPESRTPDTDWSADLTLRHLPRLFQLAHHFSNADPLVQQIRQIASDWPLSSVGIAGSEKMRLGSFVNHPGLRRLYADRIVAAGDVSRLGDPRIADLLRADLGIHRELAPSIAARLFEPSHDAH